MATAPQQQNFSSILDRKGVEIEKPKPLPVGTYATIIVGQPRYDVSSKKKTEFVELRHKMVQALEDVSQEDLATALTLPDGTTKKLQDMELKATFYLTEGAAWRVKDYLRDLGWGEELDAEDGPSLREMIESSAGKSVGVYVIHEPSQDGQSVFAKIDKTVVLGE